MITEILAILAWGFLMIKYWLTGELRLLIHPNYFGLVLATGVFLLAIGCLQTIQLIKTSPGRKTFTKKGNNPSVGNLKLRKGMTWNLPGGLMLFTAILSLIIGPNLLSSATALHRGVTTSLPVTQTQVESFQITIRPQDRSLVDWVRTINAYPEPDAYVGQPVKVTGFVIHDQKLPENYLLVGRFIITCCAIDAYSVVLPVALNEPRTNYPPDTWLEVTGEMFSQTLWGERKLVIMPKNIDIVPTPTDPYAY